MTTSIRVDGADQVGSARRAALSLAEELGFDESLAGRAALVATECAANIWKHAQSGEILLSRAGTEAAPLVEILALDKGPGMADVASSMRDGYSTAGSAGTGLGAIERLSTEMQIYT